jgi:hypothetical protein
MQRQLRLLLGEPGSTISITWTKTDMSGPSRARVESAELVRARRSTADARLIRALWSAGSGTASPSSSGLGPVHRPASGVEARERPGGTKGPGGSESTMVGWLKNKARELGRRPAALLKGYTAPDEGGPRRRGERSGAGAGAGTAASLSRSTLAGQVSASSRRRT